MPNSLLGYPTGAVLLSQVTYPTCQSPTFGAFSLSTGAAQRAKKVPVETCALSQGTSPLTPILLTSHNMLLYVKLRGYNVLII